MKNKKKNNKKSNLEGLEKELYELQNCEKMAPTDYDYFASIGGNGWCYRLAFATVDPEKARKLWKFMKEQGWRR